MTPSDEPAAPDSAPDPHPETRIDAAWATAQATPDDDDAAAKFLDVVLSEALICPVWEEADAAGAADGGPEGASEGASGEPAEGGDATQVAPKMIEIEGKDTLLLFDSEERLAAFIEEPTAFVALPGRAYFEMLAGQDAQIGLNLEVAPSSTLFGVETVSAVGEILSGVAEEVSLDPGAPLIVSAPSAAPSGLVGAIAARLNASRAVAAEAWLATVSTEDPEAPGAPGADRRLVLVLRPADGVDRADLEGLAMELGQLGASFLEDQPLDVAVVEAEDALLVAARAEGFGLIRAAS